MIGENDRHLVLVLVFGSVQLGNSCAVHSQSVIKTRESGIVAIRRERQCFIGSPGGDTCFASI